VSQDRAAPLHFDLAGFFGGIAVGSFLGGRIADRVRVPLRMYAVLELVLDGLDGRVARMTRTQSAFGAEYDSLADMVSFGAAPALVIYEWVLRDMGKLGWIAAFVYVAGAALRLARFNTLLEVADSSMTYRRRYFAEAQLPPVLDLLLADGTNPRALRFQLDTMAVLLSHLPRHPRAPSPTHEERTVAHAIASLRVADFDALSQPGADVAFDRLTAVLDVLDADLRAVSDAITFHYFSHAEQRVN